MRRARAPNRRKQRRDSHVPAMQAIGDIKSERGSTTVSSLATCRNSCPIRPVTSALAATEVASVSIDKSATICTRRTSLHAVRDECQLLRCPEMAARRGQQSMPLYQSASLETSRKCRWAISFQHGFLSRSNTRRSPRYIASTHDARKAPTRLMVEQHRNISTMPRGPPNPSPPCVGNLGLMLGVRLSREPLARWDWDAHVGPGLAISVWEPRSPSPVPHR